MRVLMTTDTVGGVWTFTRELASGLLRRGCAVAMMSFGSRPNQEQRMWFEETQKRWGAFCFLSTDIPLEWMQDNQRAYSDAEPMLLRLVGDFLPDVLHSNQFCFGALPVNVPRVITAHSDVLSWADACRHEKLDRSPWLDQYVRLVRRGLGEADAVVTPTRWMLDALATHFSLPQEGRVISNGRMVARSYRPASKRKLQAASAGRLWDEAKNIDLLRQVESPIPLLVVGPDRSEDTIATKACGQMRYLGCMTEHQLLQLFCESAIYICSSRYEPFGLAPLEAALCGCAVLANNIASLREVWQDSALYFNDAASLSRLLHRLQSDPQLLAVIQRHSYQQAVLFTADAMVERYLQLFYQLSCREAEACNAA